MLSSISLNDFKSFRRLEELDVKPVTVLCGTNSCGKSSILQSLLMLKQTKESRSRNNSILLNGSLAHLGAVENVIFGKDRFRQSSFKFRYSFNMPDLMKGNMAPQRRNMFLLSRFLIPNDDHRSYDTVHHVDFEFGFGVPSENKGFVESADVSSFKVAISSVDADGRVEQGGSVIIDKVDRKYRVSWDNIFDAMAHHSSKENFSSGSVLVKKVIFENLFPNIIEDAIQGERVNFREMPFSLNNFLRAVDEVIVIASQRLTYVGPLREEPSRRYIYDNEVLEIGSKGENAAYIYQTEFDNHIGKNFIINDAEKYVESNDKTLSGVLNYWLGMMGIKGFCTDSQSEIIHLNLDASSSSETKVNIADVGFGVSQIFPIILEGLRMPRSGSLLLEQPEIHLHPSLQMKMADYFVSLALNQKNVIVETHSDHVINRLVRRILEDEEHGLAQKIAIYFVSNSDQGAVVEEVVIDPYFGIVNWPEGFFDQAAGEQERIMRAGLKKRKARKGK